jgi:hypothetical protein
MWHFPTDSLAADIFAGGAAIAMILRAAPPSLAARMASSRLIIAERVIALGLSPEAIFVARHIQDGSTR